MAIVEVDFTGVQTGAGFLEPGLYRAQVEKVDKTTGKNYDGLKWTWSSIEPETHGQRADLFTSLAPQSLWVLKGILVAFGAEIPQSAMRFDTDKLIGKKALIKVFHEPWTDSDGNEKKSSKIDKVFAIEKTTVEPESPLMNDPGFAPNEPDGDIDFGDDDSDGIPF